MAENHQPVWTDRPGEAWTCVADAARALSLPPTSVLAAVREGREYAGRKWFGEPPDWAVAAAVEAERLRAESVRCNPGRNGRVFNGCDVRTGRVYVGGQAVEPEGVTA